MSEATGVGNEETMPARDTEFFPFGSHRVRRMGYGTMRLSGPQAFGPPADRDGALAVLREVVAAGVDHLDTSDYHGLDGIGRQAR